MLNCNRFKFLLSKVHLRLQKISVFRVELSFFYSVLAYCIITVLSFVNLPPLLRISVPISSSASKLMDENDDSAPGMWLES